MTARVYLFTLAIAYAWDSRDKLGVWIVQRAQTRNRVAA